MAIKITQFHVWLRSYPKSQWSAIRAELYSSGSLPLGAEENWRLARITSGNGAKLGVISAKDVPHVASDEILWLKRCTKSQAHDYFMRTTSGWAGNVRGVIRYYREDFEFGSGYRTHILGGLPEGGSPNDELES
jgi:hypothetical protein